jgi:hypothetical protein
VLIRNYRKERQKQREEAHAAANLHLLAQFGLSLLHALLKRSFFDMKDPNQLSMLDPFASLLLASLKSHFNRITVRIRNIHTPATFFFFCICFTVPQSLALKCFMMFLKMSQVRADQSHLYVLQLPLTVISCPRS